MNEQEAMDRWNALAKKHDLCKVMKMTPLRFDLLKRRIKDFPDFWEDVDRELGLRGAWAKEHRFPAFDKLLEVHWLLKLLEGQYRATKKELEVNHEDVKDSLIRRILRYEGKMLKSGAEICRSSLVSASGYETRWKSLRIDQLERVLGELE